MAIRARVKGWNLSSMAVLGQGGGRDIPQGVLPTVENPQSFNLEVTDRDKDSGEDYFGFDIHTADTLQDQVEHRGAVFGRGIVVVGDEYDPDRVAETMRPLVESVHMATWTELAFRVGSLGPWEFEGWKWHPDDEELRPDPGIQAVVRDVRLLRTAIGESFSLPAEVRFGGTGVDDELTVPMLVQSPLWLRNHSERGDVIVGAGRIFTPAPDPEGIVRALGDRNDLPRAPSWELLRLTLEPMGAADT
ncbi:MAG: Imm8 family immunity protein [Actinomycetota bacterium]